MKSAQAGSSTTTYIYNALGQRIEKSGGAAGTVLMFYDEAGHIIGEYSNAGALVQETVWLGDIPVATIRPSNSSVTVYYVHADHLNTPRMITQPSTNKIAWRWDTGPWNSVAPNQNPAGLGTFVYNLRAPGQYYDMETGLYYNYFRDYDPLSGRYAESDPIGLYAGANTYSYVSANPVLRVDRKGLVAGWTDPSSPPDSIFPASMQIVRGTPKNACTCTTVNGSFPAPPGVNFSAVKSAGQTDGLNPFAWNNAVGHFGTYDYQRNYINNQFTFMPAYTDASNYAVGVYLQSVGFSLDWAIHIAQSFAQSMSSNAGDPRQQALWIQGWNDANDGLLPGACHQ